VIFFFDREVVFFWLDHVWRIEIQSDIDTTASQTPPEHTCSTGVKDRSKKNYPTSSSSLCMMHTPLRRTLKNATP
jgi:hypothetical protein